jgi:multiple sugar transport system permease protein
MSRLIDRHIKWFFAAPALVFMMAMIVFPIGMTFVFSLTDWNLLSGAKPQFNFGQNYGKILSSPEFWASCKITFWYTFLATFFEIVFGLAIALILNCEFRWKKAAKAVVLLPYMMAPVAVGLMWMLFYEPSSGIINFLFRSAGLPQSTFTSAQSTVVPAIAAVEVWQMTPMVIIVCLAGLSSLPLDPVEAARVDGANSIQVFFKVTLPMLMPTIFSIGLLRFIDIFKSFDLIYAMTKGGPANASRTLNLYAYETAFSYYRFGDSSAILTLVFLIVLVISIVIINLQKRWEEKW